MKLHFREYGEGQPMVILHGLFGQSDNWNTLGKKFAENGFRVFLIDQRNHGLSPHSDTWTYEAMASDLKEFIDDHQIANPLLIGHSMGAKTVLFFEKQFPGVAKKLVIADMAARQYENHHTEVLKALNAVDFSRIHNRKEAEAILKEYISDNGTRQFLLKNIYWKLQEEGILDWRFNLKVISDNYDNVSVEVPFFESDAPALILRGGKSRYVQEEDVTDFKKRFSKITVVTIDGAGHWLHAEKPDEFFDEVMAFTES